MVINGITIKDSRVSFNHLMYLSAIQSFSMRNVFITNVTKSKDLAGDLRVLKIDTLDSLGSTDINYINVTNFIYTSSQMSFFDFQGGQISNNVSTQQKSDPTIPHLGDIAIRITDSLFEYLILSDKQRLFTTQDIKQRGIIIVIDNTTFRGNTLEKGFQFDFKHNFRQTTFTDCVIEGNNGYFLEADPSDQRNQSLA